MRAEIAWGSGRAKCKVCKKVIGTNEKQLIIQAHYDSARIHIECIRDYTGEIEWMSKNITKKKG